MPFLDGNTSSNSAVEQRHAPVPRRSTPSETQPLTTSMQDFAKSLRELPADLTAASYSEKLKVHQHLKQEVRKPVGAKGLTVAVISREIESGSQEAKLILAGKFGAELTPACTSTY